MGCVGGLYGKGSLQKKGHAVLVAKEIVQDLYLDGIVKEEQFAIVKHELNRIVEIIRQAREMEAKDILGIDF